MTTIPKTTRAAQIAATIEAVSKYFSVDPGKVLTSFAPKNQDVARARILVWHHLHRSGLSFAAIARIFGKLSPDNVSRRVKYGMLAVTSEESLLLSTLPKIETSLEIRKA
jgi:hypothetical protein